MSNSRIYLSPPNVGNEEEEELLKVIKGGWISSVGSAIDDFEQNLELIFSNQRVLALNSGTSALHLSLVLSGVGRGDDVIVGSFTFASCANVVLYQGATPVFMDSEAATWNLDPDLLKEYLKKTNKLPKALILTHLYGVPARIVEIKRICDEYNVILIEDAAEALGSSLDGKPLGSFGDYGIVSFNGNKIVTTSGGGALIVNEDKYKRGLHLATQANSGQSDYLHYEVGFNYRISNVLAALGLAQLKKLDEFVSRKRFIFDYYRDNLSKWFEFPIEKESEFNNRWLTTPLAKGDFEIVKLVDFLEQRNIETRRLWRPLHLHPAYDQFAFFGSNIAENLYSKGICLPSGTGILDDQLSSVTEEIIKFMNG
jgi:pyridoxal phosphate-dependent aminotransferase EpsN